MKREHIIIVLVVLLVALCIVADIVFASHFKVIEKKEEETTIETIEPETTEPVTETTAPETTVPHYESPIDFASFKEQNEHIYAWIDIPGSSVSQPVLQHPTDNGYYNRRGIDKNYSVYGCVFTEVSYNSTDFNDPVTVMYGHHTTNGLMFGDLQKIYKDNITDCDEIVVYLPEKELRYKVFAALVYDDHHILYYNDFNNADTFNRFFGNVISRSGNYTVTDKECVITPEDKVIILSTCFSGSSTYRYLVMAKLVETVE